jgi:hypothetical protein
LNTEENITRADGSNTTNADRRRTGRRRLLKRATIVFQRGHCTMRCQILNISETGALLCPADVLLCPSEFTLKPEIGQAHDCEWSGERAPN